MAPPNPPMIAPSGMKVKKTSMPLPPSKSLTLKIFTHAMPTPTPIAAPNKAPRNSPMIARQPTCIHLVSAHCRHLHLDLELGPGEAGDNHQRRREGSAGHIAAAHRAIDREVGAVGHVGGEAHHVREGH